MIKMKPNNIRKSKLRDTDLAIKLNYARPLNACGVCQKITRAETPLGLFVAESGLPVCDGCGKAHAPGMVRSIQLLVMAEEVSAALHPWISIENMGVEMNDE
jgi:hypothetical protein